MVEPRELTIEQAAHELRTGQVSAADLASSCLEQITRLNGDLNAFIHLRSTEQVLSDARRTDERRRSGTLLGQLDGIPIGLKANYAYTELPTSAGSKILSDWRPTMDAATVRQLRGGGVVILGMTNMHEFADGPTNENPHYGSALNPHDWSRTPGGSSGGSAVALRTNMCLGATGSDDGGSIRVPAAFCGVVGLKPTYGLLDVEGVVPFSHTLDHLGPLARTPRDALTLLNAMSPRALSADARPAGEGNLVLGLEQDYFGRYVQAGVRKAFDNALAILRRLGHEIREIQLPRLEKAAPAILTILFSEAAVLHHEFLETRLHDYSRDVRLSLLSGRLYRAVDYLNAQAVRAALSSDVDAVFESVDVVITPTAVLEAPRWDSAALQTDEGEVELLEAIIRCTAPFNLTGHPAMSVPCGLGDEGLPVGIQLVGPRHSEGVLAELAESYLAARNGDE